MAKISKNAKKLLALTLAGVMTVGTAVPASAATSAQVLSASNLTEEQNAEVQSIIEKLNQVSFKTYYNTTESASNVANTWKNAVDDQVELEAGQSIEVGTVTGTLESGKKNTIKIPLTIKLDSETSAEVSYEIYVYCWTLSNAADAVQSAVSTELTDKVAEVASSEEKDIRAAAEAKAEEALEAVISDWSAGDENEIAQADMLKNYLSVSFSETQLNTTSKTWLANVVVSDKVNGGNPATSSGTFTVAYKVEESTYAKDILEKLSPDSVTVITEDGTVDSQSLVGKNLFKGYFGDTWASANNNIVKAIKSANTEIASAVLTNEGAITGEPGSQSWKGEVTITLTNGESATGTVIVPLSVERASSEYTDISIEDNRTTQKVLLKDKSGYSLDGVTITLTAANGKKTSISGNDIKTDSNLVIDEGNYDNTVLGNYTISIRIKGDNAKYVTVPVQVYAKDEITLAEVNLPETKGNEIKSVKSDDETILKGISGGTVEVYKAGTTTATVTDNAGNSIVVKCVVSADGTVKYTTDFESYQVDKTIGTGFAELAKGQDVAVSVKDSEIASASYSVDSVGNGHVKITPTAVGSTTLTVSFGTNHKISYSYTITVSKTGAVKVEKKSEPTIQSISLPTATKTALQDAEYYGTADHGNELVSDEKAGKKVIDSAVDADSLYVTVKTDSATDTVLLSTTDYGFSTAEYNEEASTIKVGFGGANVSVEDITVRQKWECDNGYLKINAVDYSYGKGSDKYVTVSQEQNEDGNTIFVIKPAKRLNNNSWSVVFTDKNGAKTTVSGTGLNYRLGEKSKAVEAPDITSADFTAPTKMTYTIGESFDVTGASFSYELAAVGGTYTVEVTPDMFTSGGKALDLSSKKTYTDVVFTYGTYEKKDLVVTVKEAEKKFSAEELGVPAGDKISSVTVKSSDGKIKCGNYAESFAYFTADKTNTSAAVTISTAKGNTVNVLVKVDEKGNITAEGEVQFKGQQTAVTAEELNLTPKKAVSSDTAVASAEVQGGKVIIKSLSAGSTVVTVTDADGNTATINVSVAADGSITTTVHAFNADGWVNLGNGDWGYILNGERVVSDWAYVIEADPYNNNEVGKVWYHFDSDGKMQRGWIADETGWKIYLLDSNGRMAHSQWVNAPAQESLNRPAGIYHLNDDGSVQMNGWALAKDSDSVYWLCNAGNGLFEKDNPASWSNSKLW